MEFQITNNKIKLQFVVNEANQVKLNYFGNDVNYINAPSNFVELELSETNHTNKNPGKKCNTYFSVSAKYISHKINKNELVIFEQNEFVEVETHFLLFDNVAGFSSWNIVKNISNKKIHLEYISSFYIHALGQDDNPTFVDMSVTYAKNGWNSECQWKEESFIGASLFNTNNKVNMNQFTIFNKGSWSTKNYLPIIGVSNKRKNQMIMSQIENNGSWVIDVGDIYNKYYLSVSGPTMYDSDFVKALSPGEYFLSCKASTVIGVDFESSNQEMTLLRRKIVTPSLDHKEMPVIFNDFMHGTWDLSKEELLLPMIDAAAKVGCDTFVLDAGWFAEKSGWPDYIGEWKACNENYPSGGLKGIYEYIRSKGMKVGLWFEIENMGEKCPIVDQFKKDSFFIINNTRSKHAQRYALNFSKREVFNWALDVLCSAIDEYKLDYIKLDYNVDVGIGNEFESTSSGDGLLKNNRAVIRLIKTLQKLYPNLTIENCASGGQRMDYEMLKVCPIQSSSDLEDYKVYPFIATNILAACPPEVGAIWSYPVCNDAVKLEVTDEVVVANMVNSMLGRLHLASKLFKLSDSQHKLVKEGVDVHKSLAEFKKNSLPIFPNGFTKFFAEDVVAGLMDDKQIILNVWNTSSAARTVKVNLLKYGVTSAEVIYPKELTTNYSFDAKTGCLEVKFPNGNAGRTFKILRK